MARAVPRAGTGLRRYRRDQFKRLGVRRLGASLPDPQPWDAGEANRGFLAGLRCVGWSTARCARSTGAIIAKPRWRTRLSTTRSPAICGARPGGPSALPTDAPVEAPSACSSGHSRPGYRATPIALAEDARYALATTPAGNFIVAEGCWRAPCAVRYRQCEVVARFTGKQLGGWWRATQCMIALATGAGRLR